MSPNVELVLRIARAKAASLAGKFGFSRDETEDIRQDLVADLLARWPKFDPGRGNDRGFIRGVMAHRIATIIDGCHARNRDYRRIVSSSDIHGQALQGKRALESGGQSFTETRDLEIDVRRLLGKLGPELAAVVALLPQGNAREITRLLGISRSTLYRRLLELRGVATEFGLDRYFAIRDSQSDWRKKL